MNRNPYCFYCLLLVISVFAIVPKVRAFNGDSLINGLRIEVKSHYGVVLPHSDPIQYIVNNNFAGAEITLTTESRGKHPWEGLYRYPRYGIGYNYNNLRSKDILGNSHSLFGFIDVPFYITTSRFSLNYQVGFGLSYFTNTYEVHDNPLNMAISSAINYYVSIDLIGRYQISERNEVKAAFELSHHSNGKTKSPNFGLNAMAWSVGWLHSVKQSREVFISTVSIPYKRNVFEVVGNVGGKRDDMITDKVYPVSSIITDYVYYYSPKYGLGGGADLFYDSSLGYTKEDHNKGKAQPEDNFQAGLHLGFRIRYGDFNVVINAGYYIYATYIKYSPVYSRVGMRYALTDNLLLNFTLKSHLAIADFVEWGIGYRFNTSGL